MKILALFILSILSLFPSLVTAESDDQRIIVLVNVQDKNKVAKDHYEFELMKSEWKLYGKDLLSAIIRERFQSENYTTAIVKPGRCYVFYRGVQKDGAIKHYSDVYKNDLASAQVAAKKYEDWGKEVLKVGCNEIVSKSSDLNYPYKGRHQQFINDLQGGGRMHASYACNDIDDSKIFNVTELKKGRFLLSNEKLKYVVDVSKIYKQGVSKKNKKVVTDFIAKMDSRLNDLCDTPEKKSAARLNTILKGLLKKMDMTHKECLEKHASKPKRCERFNRENMPATPTGVKG